MNQYVYIFTRQDISPEQQLVQSAHVAYKLGYKTHCYTNIDPSEVYFIVVGVRNLEALNAAASILRLCCFEYETFYEPDMKDEATSIATHPVPEHLRQELLAFNLLKFNDRK